MRVYFDKAKFMEDFNRIIKEKMLVKRRVLRKFGFQDTTFYGTLNRGKLSTVYWKSYEKLKKMLDFLGLKMEDYTKGIRFYTLKELEEKFGDIKKKLWKKYWYVKRQWWVLENSQLFNLLLNKKENDKENK